ncbi:cytochrome P450 [Halobium salinum]|uniref:Cytochrome P450 n=1 Tax=Halobium salinum TaxID=1364940 RepID=A0ABD5PC17_9EURY|nr:cytochrome P450 [Halobium salinum]
MSRSLLARDRSADDPPGPDELPGVGSTVGFVRDPFAFMTRMAREYGPVVSYDVGGRTFYQLNDPVDIEDVLVQRNELFVKGELFQTMLNRVVGKGLLTSEGEFWRRQRHLVQPTFTPDRLAAYGEVMTDATAATMAEWSDGERRDVHADMSELTLSIVASALFGVDMRDRTSVVGDALDVVMARSEGVLLDVLPEWTPTPGNRRYDRAVAALDAVVDDIVAARRRNPGDDLVSALLTAEDETGRGMDLEQLRDEVKTLLLAGHETTALSLSFTLFVLAQRPDVERRLLDELETVLDGRTPTVADLDDLEYTEKVVTESMRLYPPVYGMLREPTEPVAFGGYTVPEGGTISVNQWVVHRDPQWYDDPMAFRPERWTPGMRDDLPRFAYFPFSGGPRRCIGDRFAMQEAQLVLASLYQNYHFELVSPPSMELAAAITTRPTKPIEAVVHER